MLLIQLRREIQRYTSRPFCVNFLFFASSKVNKHVSKILMQHYYNRDVEKEQDGDGDPNQDVVDDNKEK